MGYLCILVSLLAGATKGFLGKRMSGSVKSFQQSAFVNMFRMFICVAVSAVTFVAESTRGGFMFDKEAIIYGAFSGITLAFFIITWLLAVRHGAFMLISVSQMFGTVITVMCSFFVFREPIAAKRIVAIAILVVAVIIMASYSKGVKGKMSAFGILMVVLCGLSSGMNDFSLKLFRYYSESNISALNLISYIVSSMMLMIIMLLPSKDNFDKKAMFKSEILTVSIMSVCLFINSYFKTMANDYLSVAQVYPLSQAGGLILSAFMSSVFFKEKITVRCVIGLILAFVATILLK